MPRQQRFIIALVGSVLLGFFVGVFLFAWKRSAKADAGAKKVIKHTAETSADDALKYWTSERMRRAKPAKMPTTDALERDKTPSPDTSGLQDS
jgi:hypothetical protein